MLNAAHSVRKIAVARLEVFTEAAETYLRDAFRQRLVKLTVATGSA